MRAVVRQEFKRKTTMFKKFDKIEQAILLGGGYLALQMMSDIAATKVMRIGPVVMDAGIIYCITFTWRDMIHKRLGVRAARLLIVLAAAVNLLMAAYFYLVIQFPPEAEWLAMGGQKAWELIFGLVPRIVVASIVAEVVSELVDTEIYAYWVEKRAGWPQWSRVAVSNFISIPIDSALFVVVAWGGVLPLSVLLTIFVSNIATKLVLTVASFWMIYLVKEEKSPVRPVPTPG